MNETLSEEIKRLAPAVNQGKGIEAKFLYLTHQLAERDWPEFLEIVRWCKANHDIDFKVEGVLPDWLTEAFRLATPDRPDDTIPGWAV